MKKQLVMTLLIMIFSTIAAGCGTGAEGGSQVKETEYVRGLPAEDSPAFRKFMLEYIFEGKGYLLDKQKDKYIFSEYNGSDKRNEIRYFSVREGKFHKTIEPLFKSEEPIGFIEDLFTLETASAFTDPVAADSMPIISKREGNIISVRNAGSSAEWNLPEMRTGEIAPTDEIGINLDLYNEEGFSIFLENYSTGENYSIFALNDLTHTDVLTLEEFRSGIEDAKLDHFTPLLTKVDKEGKFLQLFRLGQIFDTEKKEWISVKEADYLSEDGKHVYIDGNQKEIADGVQRIQSLENYVAGNKVYEAEFKLDLMKAAEEMDYETGGASYSNILYFNNDYVVLGINYNAKEIGTEGFANVLIDLQDDQEKPFAYVENLAIN